MIVTFPYSRHAHSVTLGEGKKKKKKKKEEKKKERDRKKRAKNIVMHFLMFKFIECTNNFFLLYFVFQKTELYGWWNILVELAETSELTNHGWRAVFRWVRVT